MLYRSTDCRSRCGAAVENLAHSASFHSREKTAPSKSGIKHLGTRSMPRAAIFDVDGTLVDSVDLHASAWQEALVKFGHNVTFEQARSQIGKGGDQLIPGFLSGADQ